MGGVTCQPGVPGPHQRVLLRTTRNGVPGDEGVCQACGDVRFYPDPSFQPKLTIPTRTCSRCGTPVLSELATYCPACRRISRKQGFVTACRLRTSSGGLDPEEKAVYRAMLQGTDRRRSIAKLTGLPVPRVSNAIQWLRKNRYILNVGSYRKPAYVSLFASNEVDLEEVKKQLCFPQSAEDLAQKIGIHYEIMRACLEHWERIGEMKSYRYFASHSLHTSHFLGGSCLIYYLGDIKKGTEETILSALQEGDMTAREIAGKTGLSARYAYRKLRILMDKRLVEIRPPGGRGPVHYGAL